MLGIYLKTRRTGTTTIFVLVAALSRLSKPQPGGNGKKPVRVFKKASAGQW